MWLHGRVRALIRISDATSSRSRSVLSSFFVWLIALSFFASKPFIERRPVKLTPEEEDIRRLAFEDLPPRKVLQVLGLGSWVTSETGERLIESGKLPDAILLIVRGKVRVTKTGRVLGELSAGDIVGSALILTGIPADVDAVTVERVRAMHWQVGTLQRYLAANPETRTVMQQHLALDLARKVERLG
jgi:CRP-like cAMP-binding protein